MNAKEFEAMKRRLRERQAAEEGDPPLMLAIATGLFALLFIVLMFI